MKTGPIVVVLTGLFLGFTFYESEIKEGYEKFSKAPEQEVIFEGASKEDLKSELDRINLILDKYEKQMLEKTPVVPTPKPSEECKCNGTGKIVQGDGHVTPCTCPAPCTCKPAQEVAPAQQILPLTKEELESMINKAVQISFDDYVKNYRERAAAQHAEQQKQMEAQAVEQQPQ